MISYRALKKLIGETSLERKCRFLFGFALLFLITASFWLYASRTRRLVETQQVTAARMMVPLVLQSRHYDRFIHPESGARSATKSVGQATPESAPDPVSGQQPPAESTSATESISTTADVPKELPGALAIVHQQAVEFDNALLTLGTASERPVWTVTSADDELPGNNAGVEARRLFLDDDRDEDEYSEIVEEEGKPRKLLYFAAIRVETACRKCHAEDGSVLNVGSLNAEDLAAALTSAPAGLLESPLATELVSEADSAADEPIPKPRFRLMNIVQIDVSLESVDEQLNRNRAILLATGIVTSFLAMMAAYAIVRYIIVKPVLHLKDVSDQIARGNLNLRADISTGDEFEELSHAFNRMLRHMMTVNDELRSVNGSLDGKIDQLAQANMELFNNNKLKDDFLATISHELRTPLNSILGFSDILQSAANLDDRQKRYVGNIQASGQSLMVQINDLLDLAKIESGKMELHPAELQLAEILESQVQQILPLADSRNIGLRIEPPPQPLQVLIQDRSKITQILSNLLSNAVKFTPEGGRVRVASRQLDADFVEFSVEDTGIGIPLQEQEHIFEKFRQGSTIPGGRDHVKREYEGTGLGLSIVRELARLLGGDVSLRSEFGKGSLFSVRLPLLTPEKRNPESEPPLESRSSPGLPLITSIDLRTQVPERSAKEATTDFVVEVHSI